MRPFDTIETLERKAGEVSAALRLIANRKRLLILCRLALAGEMSVSALGQAVGLNQSALSQHLAKLREDGLVSTRRESQTLHYRIADPRIERLLGALHDIYCAPQED